jgi:hypothetical protein
MRISFFLILLLFSNVQAGVAEGIEWLENQPGNQIGDVLPGAGLNPYTWPAEPIWGRSIPDWREDGLSEATVRTLATMAAQGAGGEYPDRIRGNLSLLAEIRGQHNAISGGALLSWHLWGLEAAGVPDGDLARLIDEAKLTALQLDDGSVPCNPNYAVPNVDCTAWAVIALAGNNETFAKRASQFLLAQQQENGGFGNIQATIWAAVALDMGPGSGAWKYVLSLQSASGKFHCTSLETPCAHVWATAEAVAYLSGSYPLRHREQPEITVIGTQFTATEPVNWYLNGHQFGESFSTTESGTLYVKGDGWTRFQIAATEEKQSPVPLLVAVGALGWAAYRRKQ